MTERKTIDPDLVVLDPGPMLDAFGAIDEGAVETYELFLSTTAPLLSQIAVLLEASDVKGVIEVAHSAKGAARMTGAFRLAQVCGGIETACKQNDLVAAKAWHALVTDAFSELSAAIALIEPEE